MSLIPLWSITPRPSINRQPKQGPSRPRYGPREGCQGVDLSVSRYRLLPAFPRARLGMKI